DHRDGEDQLDLLLERVERLARERADREHRAEAGSDRDSSAECPGRRHPPARGTDEPSSQLVIGEVRIGFLQDVHPGPDRGFAAADSPRQRVKYRAQLRRQPIEVHPRTAYRGWGTSTLLRGSRIFARGYLNTYLRPCSDKG